MFHLSENQWAKIHNTQLSCDDGKEKNGENKIFFYDELERVYNTQHRHSIIIIMET